MDTGTAAVELQHVSKRYCRSFRRSLFYGLCDVASELVGREGSVALLRRDEFWALQDVSFSVRPGECLGLIGHNGAGKTTALKILNGLIKPDRGIVTLRGRVGALIALGAGFNPVLTGRENIYVNGSVLGLTRSEIERKLDEIVEFSGVGDFLDAPVQGYSSGMQVRLGFSIAASLDPDVLLVDEVLAVGDVAFRRKCYQHMAQLMERGTALILVTHNLGQVLTLCERAVVLDRGRVAFDGPAAEAVSKAIELQERSDPAHAAVTASLREGPLSIIDANVIGPSGAPLVPEAPATVELRYEARERCAEVVWNLGFVALDQTTSIASSFSLHENRSFDLDPGRGVLCFHIPCLPLAPGRYLLRLSILDGRSGGGLDSVGFYDAPREFRVHARPLPGDAFAQTRGDIVRLQGEWLGPQRL